VKRENELLKQRLKSDAKCSEVGQLSSVLAGQSKKLMES
jgi:hypothetical protein